MSAMRNAVSQLDRRGPNIRASIIYRVPRPASAIAVDRSVEYPSPLRRITAVLRPLILFSVKIRARPRLVYKAIQTARLDTATSLLQERTDMVGKTAMRHDRTAITARFDAVPAVHHIAGPSIPLSFYVVIDPALGSDHELREVLYIDSPRALSPLPAPIAGRRQRLTAVSARDGRACRTESAARPRPLPRGRPPIPGPPSPKTVVAASTDRP